MRGREILAGIGMLTGHEASAAAMPWLSPDPPDGTRGGENKLARPGGLEPPTHSLEGCF